VHLKSPAALPPKSSSRSGNAGPAKRGKAKPC
jgi:hypothetical protein